MEEGKQLKKIHILFSICRALLNVNLEQQNFKCPKCGAWLFPYKSLKKVKAPKTCAVCLCFHPSRSGSVKVSLKGPESPNVQIFLCVGLKGSAAGQCNCMDKCLLGVHKGKKGCNTGALCNLTTCLLLRLDFFHSLMSSGINRYCANAVYGCGWRWSRVWSCKFRACL